MPRHNVPCSELCSLIRSSVSFSLTFNLTSLVVVLVVPDLVLVKSDNSDFFFAMDLVIGFFKAFVILVLTTLTLTFLVVEVATEADASSLFDSLFKLVQ